jgi:uncharacterized protein YqeY
MSIQETLEAALKDAMRSKAVDTVACIRQLKSKVQEAVNQPDFKGKVDDALYQQVIASYVKALEKGIGEFAAAGDRGKPLVERYRTEIAYLSQYLPKMLGEADTRVLVEQAIAALKITDPKQSGRVIGELMKKHKGRIDTGLAKQLAESLLG